MVKKRASSGKSHYILPVCSIIIIIIIIFWLKHQYLKHKYQSMVQQIIANMLSETVYTGITNLYIITKNQQNTKQYIINVNSVFLTDANINVLSIIPKHDMPKSLLIFAVSFTLETPNFGTFGGVVHPLEKFFIYF